VLESVVNISEGRDRAVIATIAASAADHVLDVHSDSFHHRSVITLAGPDVVDAAIAVAQSAIAHLDLIEHEGVHPRLGVVDVIPFTSLESALELQPPSTAEWSQMIDARDEVARVLGLSGIPCFVYGQERTLPEIRRRAWNGLDPDTGPSSPHPTAGAACVGARPVLIAYNLLVDGDLGTGREVATKLRSTSVRALALDLGGRTQLSFNLVDPLATGPGDVFDAVAAQIRIEQAELVGLVPARVLEGLGEHRLDELGLSEDATIESRLDRRSAGRG
jgi:glutamate formiminotransferase